MRTLASIDIGTNSILLLVARVGGEGGGGATMEVLEDRCVTCRLGEGLHARSELSPEAMGRCARVVADMVGRARDLGAEAVYPVATMVLRMAGNAERFREMVRQVTGLDVMVVSGDREARLSFLGATWGLAGGWIVVLDVGGGSTELVLGRGGEVRWSTSLPMGAVTLTEGFLHSDPPDGAELGAMAEHVARMAGPALDALDGLLREREQWELVAVGGTATTLAAAHLGLEPYRGEVVQGTRLPVPALEDLTSRLEAMDDAGRAAFPGIPEPRAGVIVAGAKIVTSIASRLGVREVTVSDRGLRHGVILSETAL